MNTKIFFLLCGVLSLYGAETPSDAVQFAPEEALAPQPTLPRYQALADLYFSPYVGGEDLLFATRLCERTEDFLFRRTSEPPSQSAKARCARLTDLLAVWWPLNYEAMLIQHEVFGHGFRIRSIGSSVVEVTKYKLGVPPPYGRGGGATWYRFDSSRLTLMDESCIASAGMEATAILANLTKFKWLAANRSLDPRQAILYLYCQHDMFQYVDLTKTERALDVDSSGGNDITGYLASLNATYPNDRLGTSRLHSYSLINLLDPFTYYSLWSCVQYVVSGTSVTMPMIPIGSNLGYLFAPRLGLTPFGPEFFVENYFAKLEDVYYGYAKAGNHAGNIYVGAGFFAPALWRMEGCEIGLRADAWRQPRLMTASLVEIDENPSLVPPNSRMRLGGALSLTLAFRWKEQVGLEGEIGAKTSGFLPGYPNSASPTLRGGFYAAF